MSPDAEARPWRPRLLVGAVLLVCAGLLGAAVVAADGAPFAVDTWWNELLPARPAEVGWVFALVMNRLGGTWVAVFGVPLLVTVLLMLRGRPWAAVLFVSSSAASALVVQAVKHLVLRPRPDDMLIASDVGSFPSGHTANAATIAVIAGVLFPRVATIVAGAVWVVLMALSRTVVHVHWASDTLGGALVGAGVAFLVAALLADQVRAERRRALSGG